jgi:shikimate kinase
MREAPAFPERPIALVGLMGAGKSVVARVLGERLGAAVADLDAMLEAEEGCAVAELFERDGEPAFRRRETRLLEQALAAGADVVACGGGIVLSPAARGVLRDRCRAVWLEVTPEEAARRVRETLGTRPLLAGRDPRARLEALLAERGPLYAGVAVARVPTGDLDPGGVAEAVLRALRSLAP